MLHIISYIKYKIQGLACAHFRCKALETFLKNMNKMNFSLPSCAFFAGSGLFLLLGGCGRRGPLEAPPVIPEAPVSGSPALPEIAVPEAAALVCRMCLT